MGSSISALTNPESFNSGPWYIVDEKLANTEYIYQFPSTERSEWKGIIALFHGCSHSATDFWDKSTVCEKCLGLPQEKNLVESFINANYVVLAISSQNRVNKCWNDHDISFIYAIISQFRSQNRLNNDLYPLFAFGASSGGSIVSQLAMKKEFSDNFMGLSGVVIQISAFRINDLGKIQIPIMFDYMTRDERLADVIANIIETNDKRDENEKITIRSNGIIPHIIDASYFSQEIGSPMTSKLSSQIYDAFKMAGILDENDMLQVSNCLLLNFNLSLYFYLKLVSNLMLCFLKLCIQMIIARSTSIRLAQCVEQCTFNKDHFERNWRYINSRSISYFRIDECCLGTT